MQYLYKSTFAKYSIYKGEVQVPDPVLPAVSPSQSGVWELVSSVAAGMVIFWFWRAEVAGPMTLTE